MIYFNPYIFSFVPCMQQLLSSSSSIPTFHITGVAILDGKKVRELQEERG